MYGPLQTWSRKGNGYLSMRIFFKASRANSSSGPWRKDLCGCYAEPRHMIGCVFLEGDDHARTAFEFGTSKAAELCPCSHLASLLSVLLDAVLSSRSGVSGGARRVVPG